MHRYKLLGRQANRQDRSGEGGHSCQFVFLFLFLLMDCRSLVTILVLLTYLNEETRTLLVFFSQNRIKSEFVRVTLSPDQVLFIDIGIKKIYVKFFIQKKIKIKMPEWITCLHNKSDPRGVE